MAYAATVSALQTWVQGGVRYWRWTVAETGAEATSEYTITAIPQVPITMVFFYAGLTAGTGTTIRPSIQNATGAVNSKSRNFCYQSASATDAQRDRVATPFPVVGGTFYIRSTPDAGTDNAISTEIIIREGTL